MSFILDALKKSESDRQRQSGPALFEVKVAPPRAGLPPWAIAVAALLVLNLAIVAWIVLRRPAAVPPAVAAPAPAASVPAPLVPPAPAAGTPQAPPPPAASAPQAAVNTPPPAPPAPSLTAPAPGSMSPAALSAAPAGAAEPRNPEDYAPASEPATAPLGGRVRRGTASGVPLYQDAAATAGPMPQLRLDLHVYAARPEDRFVMINMHKLREGDSLPEGVRLETITPEGAVLVYNGSRFLLTRE